jgi:prepilin-type N-terminal cleavage/methylation domain-containing protein
MRGSGALDCIPMCKRSDVRGFSLVEMVLVAAILAVISGIAIPQILTSSRQMKLSGAARQVERELQTARMKAVKSNRPMRVRFNCPAANQYRAVELLGSPQTPAANDDDSTAAARCSPANYPFPDNDPEFFAIPNNDGPVQTLPLEVKFGGVQTIEFWPDGSAHVQTGASNPWPAIDPAGVSLTILDVKYPSTMAKSITVNGLGKITLQ